MDRLIIILSLISICFSSQPLDHKYVCDAYFECISDREQLLKMCEDKKVDEKCSRMMNTDIKLIEKYEENGMIERRKCVEEEIKETNSSYIMNKNKIKFCAGYLYNRTANDGDCSVRIGRISNRCEALKRCCEPASRCDQYGMYSENGRTLTGMKEEVDIKMAECGQQQQDMRPVGKTEEVKEKKQKKTRIIVSPPFSLCLKYLECQKDAHHMRVNCSKTTNPHSVDALDMEDDKEDENWRSCRSNYLDDFKMMNQRRDEAFAYLDKERVCKASALKDRKPTIDENCHLSVAKKRKMCALLRDCCVQADVCERSALYTVISDEYLLRRTQLRQNIEQCLSRNIEESNSVQ